LVEHSHIFSGQTYFDTKCLHSSFFVRSPHNTRTTSSQILYACGDFLCFYPTKVEYFSDFSWIFFHRSDIPTIDTNTQMLIYYL